MVKGEISKGRGAGRRYILLSHELMEIGERPEQMPNPKVLKKKHLKRGPTTSLGTAHQSNSCGRKAGKQQRKTEKRERTASGCRHHRNKKTKSVGKNQKKT